MNSSSDFRLHYYPKDLSNVETYEQILQWVTEVLGNDIPHDLIIGTADILIRQLKENEENEDGNIEERKEKIQHELGINIDSLKFNELVKLMKNITDYETHPDNSNKQAVAILADDEKSDEEEVTEMSNNANVLGEKSMIMKMMRNMITMTLKSILKKKTRGHCQTLKTI